jgi:hypothetical protein
MIGHPGRHHARSDRIFSEHPTDRCGVMDHGYRAPVDRA